MLFDPRTVTRADGGRTTRRRVLERVAAGELSAAEGMAQLQQLPGDPTLEEA